MSMLKYPFSDYGMPVLLSEVRQDLFALDYRNEWSLCHCISEDLAMGKGIAVIFRDTFGGVDELRRQSRRVGEVAVLPSGDCSIFYLITKSKYWNKPSYSDLEKTLGELRISLVDKKLTKLAMPKIGCGLDGLEWRKVRAIIERVFAGSGIELRVCVK